MESSLTTLDGLAKAEEVDDYDYPSDSDLDTNDEDYPSDSNIDSDDEDPTSAQHGETGSANGSSNGVDDCSGTDGVHSTDVGDMVSCPGSGQVQVQSVNYSFNVCIDALSLSL